MYLHFSRYWWLCSNWGYKAAQVSRRPEWSLQQTCNRNQRFSRWNLPRSLMLGMYIVTTQCQQSAGTSSIKLFWRLRLEKRSPLSRRLVVSHPLAWTADVNFWWKKEYLLCPAATEWQPENFWSKNIRSGTSNILECAVNFYCELAIKLALWWIFLNIGASAGHELEPARVRI